MNYQWQTKAFAQLNLDELYAVLHLRQQVFVVEQNCVYLDLDGLDRALSGREGSGYLLNFWAIWCAPCVAELPELAEVGQAYRERGGSVVGVSYDLMVAGADSEGMVQTMREFLANRQLDLPVLIYDTDDFEGINERFTLPGDVPVTLAIDKQGRIVDRQEGPADKARFEEMMNRALGI